MEVSTKDFDEVVLNSPIPVLLEFWASWCPPCHAIKNILKKVMTKDTGYRIVTINADRNMIITQKYNVKGLPCFIIIKQGKIAYRDVGSKSLKQIHEILEKYR